MGQFLMQSFYMNSISLKFSASTTACATGYIIMKYFKMENYQFCYISEIFNIKIIPEIEK